MKKFASVSAFAPAPVSSLIFRSTALFIILFQLRLIGADLADTSVFAVTLLAGFAIAVFLSALRPNGRPLSSVFALASICLVPWIGRALIAMPRLFVAGADNTAIILDSLLLNLDRNNFVALFPYYWSAVSTWFSLRSSFEGRKFLRAAVIIDAVVLLFIFSVARAARIELYRWPIIMIVLFSAVVFLQALALLFSMPPETKLRVKEICFAIATLLVIIVLGGFLFLRPFQEQAVEMGGGLLEPKLFSFDFSKYLKLESEISTKNDLILIVKKENDNNILLRRSVLSGYSRRQGFYHIEELDEQTHPKRLPARTTFFEPCEFEAWRNSSQEYFLVNIEASAFIGMKEPVAVSPFESWDASSFNSAYLVTSIVSDADIHDLYYSFSGAELPSPERLGLSESEFKVYTEYGNDPRLRSLAEEITSGSTRYSEKINAVYDFLKNGDYRYSLKPGIAPDGDQLGWFLFNSKKGYCTYYAFAMTLLLRSLGIPARVAAGFFVDPETNTFDYYPVRSDMAHAWVEVAFPRFGWIEFDPTTERVADDEEFNFNAGTDPALFEKLMREILENRYKMRVREGADEIAQQSDTNPIANAAALLQNYWLHALAVALVLLFLYIRCGLLLSVFLTNNYRKKSIRLMKHAFRRLRLAGQRRSRALTEPEWSLQLDSQYEGIYSMYQAYAAARFAPEYLKQDFLVQWANYKKFKASYIKKVPLWRRIVAWLFAPIAFVTSKWKNKGALLLVFLFLGVVSGSTITAQDADPLNEEAIGISADELFREASNADYNENWERAIELYKEGSKLFPDDSRFSWSLGNLYYSRSLFGLAWDEYMKTEAITPDNTALLIRIARTAGYMSRDLLSVEYYERAHELDPNNKEAIGSLGWMYFKVHRLVDAERLLVSALEQFGDDPDFAMTLGTVYSDMYRYDDSKFWYNKAITLGDSIGDRVFTAIAWYNLSILESRFYKYELCMDATNSSLNIQNRASGRLARGELFMRQLELKKAQQDYEAAYGIDTSPLAKLNLAFVYMVSGRLEEARLYAEDCLKGSDNSWMLNFGIDPDRYKKEIYKTLAGAYAGLAMTERFLPWATPYEKVLSLLRIVSYRLKYEVNIRLYRKHCLAAGNAYAGKIFHAGGPHLDSFVQYYHAFGAYPRRALAYLSRARAFETALIPAAIPSYDFEEGMLLRREHLVESALQEFDPLWEKELISKCYTAFANPKNRRFLKTWRDNGGEAAEKLFALNRGALRQEGIKLPVRINLTANEDSAGSRKLLLKALTSAGFKNAPPETAARFTLNVRIDGTQSGYTASYELADNASEVDTMRGSFQLQALTRAECYSFARSLGNVVFTVE